MKLYFDKFRLGIFALFCIFIFNTSVYADSTVWTREYIGNIEENEGIDYSKTLSGDKALELAKALVNLPSDVSELCVDIYYVPFYLKTNTDNEDVRWRAINLAFLEGFQDEGFELSLSYDEYFQANYTFKKGNEYFVLPSKIKCQMAREEGGITYIVHFVSNEMQVKEENLGELRAKLLKIASEKDAAYRVDISLDEVKNIIYKNSKPATWAMDEVSLAIVKNFVPEDMLENAYNEPISRENFARLLVDFYENYTGKVIFGRQNFDDTSSEAVEKAAYLGVINGVGDNKFDPSGILNREQAAVLLSRLATKLDCDLLNEDLSFSDKAQISAWAIEDIGKMQASQIMKGTSASEFSPKAEYSLEQSIVTMIRLYKYIEGMQGQEIREVEILRKY